MKDAAMYGCIADSQGWLQGKQPRTAARQAAKYGCLKVKTASSQGRLNGSSQIWLHEGKDGMAAMYGCLKVKTAVSRAEHGSASYIDPNTT